MSSDGGGELRFDSWVNLMTGLGTLRDKSMHARVTPGEKLGDGALESLFNDDDTARRIVSKLPREAMRRGYKIVLEADDSNADIQRDMEDVLSDLHADPLLRDGWIWARLYGGGSGVLVGADDGRALDQPLNEGAIRTVRFLNLVKRPQVIVKKRYDDVSQPYFDEPEMYTVYKTGVTATSQKLGGSIDVHASRMILFPGALTARSTQPGLTEWDDSVLQNVYAALQQSSTAWQSVAHLMTDASQGVLKIANLIDMSAAGQSATLRTRMEVMDMARSVCRSILVDAERESFERVSTSFAGLPEVMDKLMMRVAAGAEQPVTLLYGRSPAGMNATGESDIRGWYDSVSDAQHDTLKPRLTRLITLLFLAKDGPTQGRVPDRWCLEFNPLWQPTDKSLADTKKVKADTYVALVGAQIVTESEAAIGLAPDFPVIDVAQREELRDAQADVHADILTTPPPQPPGADGTPAPGDAGGDTGGQYA